jgi:uncharacterized protein (TIGR02453 family)
MTQLTKSTFNFLNELKKNNNRDWFQANKPRYEEVKKEFVAFVDALILEIAKFDPSIAHHEAKNCVFRIFRDVRFSKDKSPYKSHLGAHISAGSQKIGNPFACRILYSYRAWRINAGRWCLHAPRALAQSHQAGNRLSCR